MSIKINKRFSSGKRRRFFAPPFAKKAHGNKKPKTRIIPSGRHPTESEKVEPKSKIEAIPSMSSVAIPGWYNTVSSQTPIGTKDLMPLIILRWSHQNAKNAVQAGRDPTRSINKVRMQIQRLGCFRYLTQALVKKSELLTDQTLHEIMRPSDFLTAVEYSRGMSSDAETPYVNWHAGYVDRKLMRGIRASITESEDEHGITRPHRHPMLDPEYPKFDPKFRGEFPLKNGDWWPLQIAAVRDGAHGNLRAGIYGTLEDGAYSIVMQKSLATTEDSIDPKNIEAIYNKYPNFDLPEKDQIWYCGTAGTAGEEGEAWQTSVDTRVLMTSYIEQHDVRVLRGYQVKSKLAPSHGVRYDGLYRIIDVDCINTQHATWLFLFERNPGQDPIRYEGPDKRPNDFEVAEWKRYTRKAT